jgi:hypothetical protein
VKIPANTKITILKIFKLASEDIKIPKSCGNPHLVGCPKYQHGLQLIAVKSLKRYFCRGHRIEGTAIMSCPFGSPELSQPLAIKQLISTSVDKGMMK